MITLLSTVFGVRSLNKFAEVRKLLPSKDVGLTKLLLTPY